MVFFEPFTGNHAMINDLRRFSKIELPGLDKKCKSEKIYVTVFQYYPPENGRKSVVSGGLKNQCGTKSSDLFHMSPERTFLWKILKS